MAESGLRQAGRRLPLGKIASMRGGFVPSAAEVRVRARQEELGALQPKGATYGVDNAIRVRGLQPRDVMPDGTIVWESVSELAPMRDGDRFAVREGDLLLPLRSLRIQTVVARAVPAGVIASGPWAQLTPDLDVVDADYLAWYLNHPRTRARLSGMMSGTSLMFLSLGTVRDFEVILPDRATQRRIAHAATLNSRIAILERQLSDDRQRLVDGLTMATLDRSTTSASSLGHR